MSKALDLVIEWQDYLYTKGGCDEEFRKCDLLGYQALMAKTFGVIRECWNDNKVDREICLLFATFNRFSADGFDHDGNCLRGDLFDCAARFHDGFFDEILIATSENRDLNYDEEGKLVIPGYDLCGEEFEFHIDTESFELPLKEMGYEYDDDED